MSAKHGFTTATHVATAAQLYRVRAELHDALLRTCAAYPIKSKQMRFLERAVRELDRARSELDNAFYREHGDEVRTPYYGKDETRAEDTAQKMVRAGVTREPCSGLPTLVRLRIAERSNVRSEVEITCTETEVSIIVGWASDHLGHTSETPMPVPEYARVPWGPEYRWTSAAQQHFERAERLFKW